LDNEPERVLSAFDDALEQADVGQYLGAAAGDLDDLRRGERNLVAYLKLVDTDYNADVVCGPDGAGPGRDNVDQCQIMSIPRVAEDTHNATVAANGAVMQMFNHGLSAAGMFLLVGALYHKAHTRDLRRFGGLWHTIPAYSAVLIFTSLASLGLPGLNGFIGEWLVVAGSFPVDGFEIYILISMIGLLITGAYILKGLQKVLHGPPNEEWQDYHENHHSLEITRREMIAIAPLMVLMIITGVYPNWILPIINNSVTAMFVAMVGG
jgi:NADH:ubiquinone oxidoreductase subunit 5 (subunit L)/multisubunit Na+/H+ antiporter MnhA subunit